MFSKGNDEPGPGKHLASIRRPGAGRHRFKNRGFAPEPPIPEPGYWNQQNYGDDDANIHSKTFCLTVVSDDFLQFEDESGFADAIGTGSFI